MKSVYRNLLPHGAGICRSSGLAHRTAVVYPGLERGDRRGPRNVVALGKFDAQFAELLDSREDIKLFMKLPSKFKIDTPVGPYNPDWAIVKHEEGQDRIYMIRETKSTLDDSKLRPSELAKIRSAKRHFESIGVEDYARAVPGAWKL